MNYSRPSISKTMPDALTHLLRHHHWANLRLVQACRELTVEQLDESIPGSYGSIHATLQHIAIAERSYFSRISTGQRYNHPEDAPPMTLEDIAQSLDETGMGLMTWAPNVQATDSVSVDWEGTPREVPKVVLVTQAISHATEHREQIKAIMTMIGLEPPDLQSWTFFDESDPDWK